jgi:hypothetical protein
MKRRGFWKVLRFAPLAALLAAVIGVVVMSLWNWLMPALFALPHITFWQALGLFLFSKLLLGGFHGRHGFHGRWRGRMMERWEKMTPEEREKFRETMQRRCGPFGEAAAEPRA